MDVVKRIVLNPAIHLGKPCVWGTWIPLDEVLELVAAGIPFEDICRDYYPALSPDDVKACIESSGQRRFIPQPQG